MQTAAAVHEKYCLLIQHLKFYYEYICYLNIIFISFHFDMILFSAEINLARSSVSVFSE